MKWLCSDYSSIKTGNIEQLNEEISIQLVLRDCISSSHRWTHTTYYKMKKIALAFAILATGCMSQIPHETIDEYIPENLVKDEWDGSKGEFPPG